MKHSYVFFKKTTPPSGHSAIQRIWQFLLVIQVVIPVLVARAQPCTNGVVTNTTTNQTFCSIQAAIDDITTLDGHTLTVSAGTYTEAVTISKSLTINGPNVGIAGTGSRVTEAILSDGSINVTGSNVVIDGFHVYQTNGTGDVILLGGNSAVAIQNSKIERIGASPGQSVRAITTSAGSGVKTIQGNLFTGSTAGGLFSGHRTWNSGIYLNGASSIVNITGNTFENVRSAINLDDFNAAIALTGNTFKNSGTYLSFGGAMPTGGAYVLGANEFKTPVSGFINLSNVNNTFRLDITTSTFNGAAFNTYPLATLFQIESTMTHRGRLSGSVPRNGLVTYVTANQYVIAGQTTVQSAIDYSTAGDVIHVSSGSFNETLTVNKTLTFEGANKDICGTSASRVTETILVAPATATGVITLAGSVTATFNGLLVDGMGVAYLTQPNQGLVFKNSVFELDFLPAQNNIYAASSTLTLNCNYFKAIGGTNDGSSSHIFVGDGTFSAINNKFTSETAVSAFSPSTTSLPVWLNITASTSSFLVQNNLFTKIDIGILLGANAGNGTIQNNEFSEAKRAFYTSGTSYGTGIALFGNYTPSGPVVIQKNKFYNGETGIRTSTGDASNNFPAPGLLTISNNSFADLSFGSFRIGGSYNGSANKLSATCNWYNNAPVITGNPNNISYIPQLASGTDDDPALGFQQNNPVCVLPTQFWVNDDSQAGDGYTTAVGNDANPGTQALPFRTINHAILVAGAGATIFADAGTYNENVDVNKTLTIEGLSAASVILTPSTPNSGVGIAINAADVVIKKLTVNQYQYGININASGTAHKLLDLKTTNNSLNGISVPYGAGPEAAAITGLEINNVQSTGNSEAGLLVFATVTGSKVFDNVVIKNSDFSNNAKKGIYLERANNLMIDNVTVNNSGTDAGNGNNNNGIDINLKYAIYSGITIKNSTITNSGVLGTGGDPTTPAAIAIKARRDGSYTANPATLSNVLIDNNTISSPQNGIRIGEPNQTNDGTSGVIIQKNNLSASFANKALVNRTAANVTLICNYFGTNTDYANVVPKLAAVGTGKNLLTSIATNTTYTSCISPTGFAVSTSTPEVCVGSPAFILATGLLPSTSTTVSFNINNGSTETFTGTTTGAGGLLIDKTLPAGSYTLTVTSVEANNTISSVNPPMLVTFIVKPNVVAGTVSGASPITIGATTTYTSTGTAGGTWSSSNSAVATVNSSGLVTGVASGTAAIIYTVTGCGGTVSSQATVTVQAVPDLIPLITVSPSTMYGNTNFTVKVDVVEINSAPTSGTVVVYITKQNKYVLTLSSAPQNGIWTLNSSSNSAYYVLTTSSSVPASGALTILLDGVLTPNGSGGTLSVSTVIIGGSGGETRADNNIDVDRIETFPQ